MGISYVAVVLPRFTQGKCLKVSQGVMLKVVLGDLLEDLLGEKEGKKMCEDREHEQEEEHFSHGERSFQTHRTLSGASGREHFDKKDKELKHLRRLVMDLELEARGRCRERDHEEHAEGSTSMGGHYRERSHQFGSH